MTDIEREKSAKDENSAANQNPHTNSDVQNANESVIFCQSTAKILTMGRDITSYMMSTTKRSYHTAGATRELPNAKRKKNNLDPGTPS